MGDESFRKSQMAARYAQHVAPINRLADEAFGRPDLGWMPYVAPLHGGTEARVLSVLRDPGPKVRQSRNDEHGFLCIENDDPTAAAQAALFEATGIGPADVTPWNAYPWYINAAPTAAQLNVGIDRYAILAPRTNEATPYPLIAGRPRPEEWSQIRKALARVFGLKRYRGRDDLSPGQTSALAQGRR